jgi:hypothetical protein
MFYWSKKQINKQNKEDVCLTSLRRGNERYEQQRGRMIAGWSDFRVVEGGGRESDHHFKTSFYSSNQKFKEKTEYKNKK